jgi:hypothetical protein
VKVKDYMYLNQSVVCIKIKNKATCVIMNLNSSSRSFKKFKESKCIEHGLVDQETITYITI